MGDAKNVVLGFLSFFLIISISTAISTLAFSLTINENSLQSLIKNHIEPFIDEQLESMYVEWTEQEIESQHQAAIYVCQTEESYEIANRGEDVISLDCNKVHDTTPDIFFKNLKSAIRDYTLGEVTAAFENSKDDLRHASVVLWISSILSLILFIVLIVVAGEFSFKTFGAVGLVSGSPALVLLLFKSFIESTVRTEIQKSIPPEMLDTLASSTLITGVTGIVSEFFVAIMVSFGIIFALGAVLLTIGVLIRDKKPTAIQQDGQALPSFSIANQQ